MLRPWSHAFGYKYAHTSCVYFRVQGETDLTAAVMERGEAQLEAAWQCPVGAFGAPESKHAVSGFRYDFSRLTDRPGAGGRPDFEEIFPMETSD